MNDADEYKIICLQRELRDLGSDVRDLSADIARLEDELKAERKRSDKLAKDLNTLKTEFFYLAAQSERERDRGDRL